MHSNSAVYSHRKSIDRDLTGAVCFRVYFPIPASAGRVRLFSLDAQEVVACYLLDPSRGPSKHHRLPKITARNNPLAGYEQQPGSAVSFILQWLRQMTSQPAGRPFSRSSGLSGDRWRSPGLSRRLQTRLGRTDHYLARSAETLGYLL